MTKRTTTRQVPARLRSWFSSNAAGNPCHALCSIGLLSESIQPG